MNMKENNVYMFVILRHPLLMIEIYCDLFVARRKKRISSKGWWDRYYISDRSQTQKHRLSH